MNRARTSRNRATRSTRLAAHRAQHRCQQAPTLGNRLPRRSTGMAPAAMGVTPALPLPSAPGLNGRTPPTPTLGLGQGPGSPLPHPDRDLAATLPRHICAGTDGLGLARPMRLRRDCAWRLLPRQARAARPDCGRHPLTGSLRGTAVLGPHSRALALRSLRCVLCGGRTRGTHGVLATT
jgi:hypothetical protein